MRHNAHMRASHKLYGSFMCDTAMKSHVSLIESKCTGIVLKMFQIPAITNYVQMEWEGRAAKKRGRFQHARDAAVCFY